MKLNLAPYPSATIPNGSVVSCVQSNQVVPVTGVNSSFVSCNQPDANGACIQGLCQMAPATVLRPYATIPGGYTVPAPPLIPASESWPPSPPIPSFLQTAKWEQAFGMGDMWKREFHARFRNFAPHQWVILPVYEKPNHGIEWRNFTEAAKVRFNCKVCNHSWTSMQGKVAFWYALTENCVGYVCLQLFSQRCRECLEAKRDAPFQPALWYPEELERVLNNFYNEVGFRVYHFVPQPFQRDRRPGKPRTPHNSDLCQACDDNMCVKSDNAIYRKDNCSDFSCCL
ncbi:zf-3CxxC domain-containing protein [Caerostris extrusa]|uniref:Zf-3CxxC domain-containing protein n=1 Tax=Caerostris extrusa TaxID=172846 RepID=A0AAV4W9D0_CAEEX|nr:zf-3CxxC domain-containing protein [Caerostris extrusa]